jgi:hypothetical protein
MIVITEVKFCVVDRDEIMVQRMSRDFPCVEAYKDGDIPQNFVEVEREVVTGRQYRRGDGKVMVIGLAGQAREALGMVSGVYDSLRNRNEELGREVVSANRVSAGLRKTALDYRTQLENLWHKRAWRYLRPILLEGWL